MEYGFSVIHTLINGRSLNVFQFRKFQLGFFCFIFVIWKKLNDDLCTALLDANFKQYITLPSFYALLLQKLFLSTLARQKEIYTLANSH